MKSSKVIPYSRVELRFYPVFDGAEAKSFSFEVLYEEGTGHAEHQECCQTVYCKKS